MSKITVIGAGNVGSTIAYTLTVAGIASEIVMIDINENKAFGEAMDIRQGVSFCSPCSIYSGEYHDASGSDIVIITSGVARKPGQTRLELAQTNINIIKDITPKITKYAPEASYIIVSNPVDILTYVFTKYSGIPENRIIGSGTLLDSARLRSYLSEYYAINQNNIHAYVLGEHGDSSFVPWSLANISNIPIQECGKAFARNDKVLPELNYPEVEDYVRKSGATVIANKGATFYAVSASVCHICKALMGAVGTTMTVSTMFHGEYGIEDVCLSTLCNMGNMVIRNKIMMPLNDEEIVYFRASAQKLKETLKSVEI
ncbi:MAG: L-lactate dehydrogenase [Ruminococcaceae bacterium]|nr:L-lactate dehydrogenase [Oscillospiraceae bacterium]